MDRLPTRERGDRSTELGTARLYTRPRRCTTTRTTADGERDVRQAPGRNCPCPRNDSVVKRDRANTGSRSQNGDEARVAEGEHAGRRVNDYLADITKTIHEAAGPCTVEIDVRPETATESATKKSSISDDEPTDIEEIKKLPTVTAKSAEEELLEAFPDAKFVDGDS